MNELPYHIMYFNLKPGAKEEDLVEHLKIYGEELMKRCKGFGGYKLYKHFYLGGNRRNYQYWMKIDDFATIDREINVKFDPDFQKWTKENMIDKGVKSFYDLVDTNDHLDEVVCELYPEEERSSRAPDKREE